MRQSIDDILHQVEAIQVVLHPNVKGCCDRALFYISPHMQIAVGPAVGQPVDQPGVPVKPKNDVFVFREERVVILLGQPVWVLRAGLQLHEINNIYYPDFQVGYSATATTMRARLPMDR